jgi:hypothetical protein
MRKAGNFHFLVKFSGMVLALALLLPTGQASAVTTADEICLVTDDPCVISSTVVIDSAATIDFGLRTVNLVTGGQLDFGNGVGTQFLCGEFNVTATGNALKMRGPDAFGDLKGARATIATRRACSGDGSIPCVSDGACTALGGPGGTCTATSTGNMTIGSNIQGNAVFPAVLSLLAGGDVTLSGNNNVFGTSVVEESDGGEFTVIARGDVAVNGKIDANGKSFGFGGTIEIRSLAGSVSAAGEMTCTGGGSGGDVSLDGATGVTVTENVSVSATDGAEDGGSISIVSGGDIVLSGGSNANRVILSADGHGPVEGFGGWGGNINLNSQSGVFIGEFVRFQAMGALPDGDGGDLDLSAGGNITVDGELLAQSLGAEGTGGNVSIAKFSGVDVTVGGSAKIDVSGGFGGTVVMNPVGTMVIAGMIDASGTGGEGGSVDLSATAGDTTLSGTVKSTGTAFGIANGSITLDLCRLNATSTADLNTNGDYGVNSITIRESGSFAAGGQLQATGTGGQNGVIYRDPAKVPTLAATATPAVVLSLDETLIGCPVCGNSEIDYGESCDDGNLVDGDGCAADCQLETCIAQTPGYPGVPICDDGSGCTVDVCDQSSGNCQNTSSCDDGIACTDDSCDLGTNTCVNTASNANCDDGNVCTNDSCVSSGCIYTAAGGSCDDNDVCTDNDLCVLGVCAGTDNGTCFCNGGTDCSSLDDQCNTGSCNEQAGACEAVPVGDGTACDDGAFCTTGETCTAGACGGGSATDCSGADDQCNTGSCNETSNACEPIPVANGTTCDDGLFCNGTDTCSGGSCSLHSGLVCPSVECGDVCDESADICAQPQGTPCTDDGNECTDDQCDGLGACVHDDTIFGTSCTEDGNVCTDNACSGAGICVSLANTVSCDDGDPCTLNDTCALGVCAGIPIVGCGVTTTTLPACSDTLGIDQCKLKAKFRRIATKPDKLVVSCKVLDASAAVAGIDPSVEQMLFALDDAGGVCFTTTTDPADCVEKKGSFKCKPPKGTVPYVKAKLRPDRRNPGSYKLKYKAKDADLQCLDYPETPWTMGLEIGDDCGQVDCPSTGSRIECPGE